MQQNKVKMEKSKKNTKMNNNAEHKMFAAIRLRGAIDVRHDMKQTLRNLNLLKTHNCIFLEATPANLGMLKKVKDYVTYGEVSDEVVNEVKKKRILREKTYVLGPPRGGFEKGGIKRMFTAGGALGRRNNMDALLKKMI